MPRSWLSPAVEGQRSALPLTRAVQLPAGGVKLRLRLLASTSVQVLPLLPRKQGWPVKVLLKRVLDAVGTSCTVSRVGEKAPAMGPAPAKIEPGSGSLAFHCSLPG